MSDVSRPQELGKDEITAFRTGWNLYWQGKEALREPSATPGLYSIKWGIKEWQGSLEYKVQASGEPKAPRTIEAYDRNLAMIEGELGRYDLRSFERKHAKGFYREQREKRGASMSAQIMRTLRALYSFFLDQGWYRGENPVSKMRLHVPKRTYESWTFERVKAFYEQAAKMNRRSVGLGVALIYDTAQNHVDILALGWRQFDGQGLKLGRQKTGQQTYVPLSDWTQGLLAQTDRAAVQVIVSEETKRPYTYRNFAKWVAIIRDAAGLPATLKAGNLRHEAGQEAEQGGADPGAIQSLLAHKSVGTQRYYVKRMRAADAQAARARFREREKNKR